MKAEGFKPKCAIGLLHVFAHRLIPSIVAGLNRKKAIAKASGLA